MTDELLWPVYEFRPLPTSKDGPWLRYADGRWIKDDGEYDVAFISAGWGGVALGFEPPYQRNIIWSWVERSWADTEPRHPRGNAWHYMLRDGATTWGGHWHRDRHPNYRAREAAVSELCSRRASASGTGPEMRGGDPWIAAGLLRERDTKRIVAPPDPLICMYCGANWLKARK